MKITYRHFLLAAALLTASQSAAEVRLKDVARVRDQQELQLIGYGLVVGLPGTGDNRNTQFTIRTLANFLKREGIDVPASTIKVKNVAGVMVTATVSPYVKVGGRFDITVSSTGDASSLEGGTLLLTLLHDSAGVIYGKALGPITLGGTQRAMDVPGGMAPGGGVLLLDVPTLGMDEQSLTVTLMEPDYTTAFRVAEAVNERFGAPVAQARDAGSITLTVPSEYAAGGGLVQFIAELETVAFEPDERAKVVINERTGTIVAGGRVSLGAVAITHGTLSLNIGGGNQAAAAPGAGSSGDHMVALGETANVSEVAQALNLMGVSPDDLIAIFQALKRAGSLRAELVIM